ncbi:MAG: hypothetical protein NG740_01495 [Omnitrophica bacterium]|nr:hypothetical protein [Candidatus Omnitrophota bacterium]
MENAESVKAELESKQKELEALGKKTHTPKEDRCGGRHHRDSADLWIQIEGVEEEIEVLKKRLNGLQS